MINFQQFKSMDIRIARVKDVRDHPNADKLYIVTVDTGEGDKTVVAGIKNFYDKESLLNKQVVLLNNLEPAEIRGVASNGMILATKDGEKMSLLVPEKEVKDGSPVS